MRYLVVPAFLLACLLLGGSPQGIWRNLALQLTGALLIVWAFLATRGTVATRAARNLLLLCFLWLGLVLLQLVPMPPSMWTALPGRELASQGFTLRGEPLPWLPLSLTPAETAATLPVMLVPLGLIAAMLWLGAFRSRWCVVALLLGTAVSVVLGALQLAQGGPYLYPIANEGAATGLFANSNHAATLLLAVIPFLAAAIARELGKGRTRSREGTSRLLIASGGILVVLVGGTLNGSMAALMLLLPTLLASSALLVNESGGRGRPLLALLAGLLLLGGAAAIAVFTAAGSERTNIVERSEIYDKSLQALSDSFPAGTGLGSFQRVYRLYENPDEVGRVFVNHAHSDPIEWLLETGILGALLLAAFLFWWARQALGIWREEKPDLMALAGTIGSAVIMAHSLVDYPLRDAALQAVFALSLAFMVDPRRYARTGGEPGTRRARHLSLDDLPARA